MSFTPADFKYTSRSGELGRQLYPHQLRDDRYLAAIDYAIGYYEQMLGRARREFEAATLLEFFGDPKLARGLVACLSQTYRWHQPQLAEVLDQPTYAQLAERGLRNSADFRALLYAYANQTHGFILPSERWPAVNQLAAELGLTPSQFERVLYLDDEQEALLVRSAERPEPSAIVALYNFHSLETGLRNCRSLQLRLDGDINALAVSAHNLAQRYNLRYELSEPEDCMATFVTLTLYGAKDALGNWTRTGRRIARCALRLLAAHPNAASEGLIQVHMQGKNSLIKLAKRELTVLGGTARQQPDNLGDSWETTLEQQFSQAWSRLVSKGQNTGWRIRRDPVPFSLAHRLLVPDFIAQRGSERIPIFVPATEAMAASLAQRLVGQPKVLVVIAKSYQNLLRNCQVAKVIYQTTPDMLMVLAQLEQLAPAQAPLDRWSRLALRFDQAGFVAETELLEILECRNPVEIGLALRGWREDTAQYVPNLGLFTPQKLRELGSMLGKAA